MKRRGRPVHLLIFGSVDTVGRFPIQRVEIIVWNRRWNRRLSIGVAFDPLAEQAKVPVNFLQLRWAWRELRKRWREEVLGPDWQRRKAMRQLERGRAGAFKP